jgi:geranylgeranyl pyrophosphate synthase
VVQYNVPKGKRNRGLALVMSYRLLAPIREQTSENLELARILGWCVELLQAYFLVVDDLVDQSITRRGQLCWYRQVSHLIHFSQFPNYINFIITIGRRRSYCLQRRDTD